MLNSKGEYKIRKRDLEKLDRIVIHCLITLGHDYAGLGGEIKLTVLDGPLAEEDVEFTANV